MKRNKLLLLLLFLLCLLPVMSGCSAQEHEPVRALQCTHPAAVPELLPTGGAVAAVCWADYENGRTTVQIVDAEADAVLHEVTLDGIWVMSEQALAGGRLALCSRDANTWRFLSASLEDEGSMSTENVDGFFSYDGGGYYFLRDNVLCRQELETGQVSPAPLAAGLRILDIAAYDAASGRMAVRFFLSPYSSECGTAILNTDTGQLSMLRAGVFQASFNDGGPCLMNFDADAMGYSVLYGSEGRFFFADASLFAAAGGDIYAVPGSPYLIGISTGSSTLYSAGAQLTACPLSEYGISGELYAACYLPEKKLLIGASYQDGACRLYAISPSRLSLRPVADAAPADSPLTVDEALVQSYWGAVSGAPVAESLQQVRQYADALETQYGVRILLSSQCRDAAALCDRAITLTDTMNAEAELEGVNAMLDAMSRSFALYPEGFLPQFQNDMGEGGLCFLLVAHIDSSFGIVGCTYETADRIYIALDVQDTYSTDGLICHEIWHATESRIISHDYTAFDYGRWAALNPEGFSYCGDGAMQDPAQGWTLYNSPAEDIHFVDSYACVDPGEDRARIMEYFMTHDDEAQLLIQSPYIRQKLQWMCAAVRAAFNTAGWENVRWERLL